MRTGKEILLELDYAYALERARSLVDKYEREKELRERMESGWPGGKGWYKWRKRYSDERDRLRKEFIGRCLRPATVGEYSQFLVGYLERGGKITTWLMDENLEDAMKNPFRNLRDPYLIWLAPTDFLLPAYCGSSSLRIIIPAGVEVDMPDGVGHSSLYFMKDFTVFGLEHVLMFKDVRGYLNRTFTK